MLNQNSLLLITLEPRTKEILNQTRTNFARKQKKNTFVFLSYNNTVSMLSLAKGAHGVKDVRSLEGYMYVDLDRSYNN